jgi:HAMP domain-containing protein
MITTPHFAALFGVAGALLLAWNGRRAAWGWVLFLASNIGWIIHALASDQQPLLWQTLVFTATSALGIWRWLIGPVGVTPPSLQELRTQRIRHIMTVAATYGWASFRDGEEQSDSAAARDAWQDLEAEITALVREAIREQ